MEQWERFLKRGDRPLNQGEIRRLYAAALKERGEQNLNSKVSQFTLWFFDAARKDQDCPVIFRLHELEASDPDHQERYNPLWVSLKSGLSRKILTEQLRNLTVKEERDYLVASILIQLIFLFPTTTNKHKVQSNFVF